MQKNQNEDFQALSEKYKKELMSYYHNYKPTVVAVPTAAQPQPQPAAQEPAPEPVVPEPAPEAEPVVPEPEPVVQEPEPVVQESVPEAQPVMQTEPDDNIDMDILPVMGTDIRMSTLDGVDAHDLSYETYTSEGYLRVQVVTAKGALPVAKAVVQIKKVENGTEVYSRELITDESGNTEVITLKAPNADLSQAPDPSDLPYADYQAFITAKNFLSVSVDEVPVFSGVLSVQPVMLIPGVGTEGDIEEEGV